MFLQNGTEYLVIGLIYRKYNRKLKNMNRVLIVACDGLENAGVQNVIMCIVRELHTKYTFDIVLFNNVKGYYDEEFLSYGGKIFRLPEYSGRNLLLHKMDNYTRWLCNRYKVAKLIRENGPYTAIHCNNDYDGWYLLQIANKEGIPVRICHVHRIVSPVRGFFKSIIFKRWHRQIMECSNVKLGCSEVANQSFYGRCKDSIVVNNPYNSKRFDPKAYPRIKESRNLTILQIGSFCDNKNQLFTLEVFRVILKSEPDAHLSFVGFELEKGYMQKLKDYIYKEKIENSISFHCSDADTPSLLSTSSCLIFPSKKEGFGVVLVEAQAMGVCCYVSDTVPKETNVGGCFFLPLKDNPEKWAHVILQGYYENKIDRSYDCSKFDSKYVANIYDGFYSQ